MLRRRDRLTPAEQHYLKHVVAKQEWPPDTTIEGYLDSSGMPSSMDEAGCSSVDIRGTGSLRSCVVQGA
jgi:hypothetical protein